MAYLIIASGLNGHKKLDISLLGDEYYDKIKGMVSKIFLSVKFQDSFFISCGKSLQQNYSF